MLETLTLRALKVTEKVKKSKKMNVKGVLRVMIYVCWKRIRRFKFVRCQASFSNRAKKKWRQSRGFFVSRDCFVQFSGFFHDISLTLGECYDIQ